VETTTARRIAVAGPGRVGLSLAGLWRAAGHEIGLTAARSPDKLAAAARWVGGSTRALAAAEVAGWADAVLLAVPWWTAQDVVIGLELQGTVLLDAVNPYTPGWGPRDPGLPVDVSAAERIAEWAPGASVVKAFNTIPTAALTHELARRGVEPPAGHLRSADASPLPPDAAPASTWAVLLCGDDPAAVGLTADLVHDAGFAPVTAGPLSAARRQELGGAWYGVRWTPRQALDHITAVPPIEQDVP
jgi:predicted dinucleotide-binding enzyme